MAAIQKTGKVFQFTPLHLRGVRMIAWRAASAHDSLTYLAAKCVADISCQTRRSGKSRLEGSTKFSFTKYHTMCDLICNICICLCGLDM